MTDKPTTGMGATVHVGSDRYAYTVECVIDTPRGTVIVLQADTVVKAADFEYYQNQNYTHVRNPKGERVRYRYDAKRGEWRRVVQDAFTGNYKLAGFSSRIVLGERHTYSDPSF